MKANPTVKRRHALTSCRECRAWDGAVCGLSYRTHHPAGWRIGLFQPAEPCPRPMTKNALREAPRREELED